MNKQNTMQNSKIEDNKQEKIVRFIFDTIS